MWRWGCGKVGEEGGEKRHECSMRTGSVQTVHIHLYTHSCSHTCSHTHMLSGAVALHVNSNEHTDDPGREAVLIFDAKW